MAPNHYPRCHRAPPPRLGRESRRTTPERPARPGSVVNRARFMTMERACWTRLGKISGELRPESSACASRGRAYGQSGALAALRYSELRTDTGVT